MKRSIFQPCITGTLTLALQLGCSGEANTPGSPVANGTASFAPQGGVSAASANASGAAIPSSKASSGSPSTNASAGNPTGTVPPVSNCSGSEIVATKRIVRLSFNQIANSVGTLIDAKLTPQLSEQFELVDTVHRAFPPLQSPREGNSLTDLSWSTTDRIASAVGDYVAANFATTTKCGETPTDDCAQKYLSALAQKAYRRPLTTAEQTRLLSLYTTALKGSGASVQEGVQYGVYAIFQSPQFLYRTEFGADWQQEGALTAWESASMLSYFLTDGTPDQGLLDAATQNKLSTPEEIGAQVDRLLQTPAARTNLEGAMLSYFSYPNLDNQVINDNAFTGEMRSSMYREAELFLRKTLWNAPLSELLTSRKGFVNATLAPIYGITQFPPAGVALDAEKFAEVELPANRTGLLTQPGFLANRSRPDKPSVVGRGLLVKNAFLCTETPEPPESLADTIKMFGEANADASEREQAQIRGATPPCNACHLSFDAYGLALDAFDVIGRYRTLDPEGRAIDPSVTLPEQVGGGSAKNIVEVAQKLAGNGAFAKCMGQNLVNYALADVSAGAANVSSCGIAKVAASFEKTDRTFSSLIRAIATSAVFSNRSKGVTQ